MVNGWIVLDKPVALGSTQAVAAVKRETGGWRIPLIQLAYMFVLAYFAAFLTYRIALSFGA